MQRLNDLARHLPELPRRVLVGLSGGADSVALMRLMLLTGREALAVHVNHGLRGEASDGDEAFVRALCASLNVPLTVCRLQPPEHPGEDWARRERYRCFRETMAATGAEALVLAHHRDDQAETLLLHLMRGAGLTGLTAMAADATVDGLRIIRPLMGFTRQELRDALMDADQPWREDASNQDSRYLRNAVRNDLLPLMERLSPGCGERLAATAGLLQEDDAALESLCGAFLRAHARADCLPIPPLLEQPEGLQRRILRKWWQQAAGARMDERSLSRPQTEALTGLVHGRAGEKCNLPGGWHGYRGWTHLHLISPGAEASPTVSLANPETLAQGWIVRTRQPGDWLYLPGRTGKKSLQDYFTDGKIDAPFRDRIPLVCRDDQVLAIAGLKLPGEAAVCLRWQGDMPWINQHTKA